MKFLTYVFGLALLIFGCSSCGDSIVSDAPELVDVSSVQQIDSLISPRDLFTDVQYIKLKSSEVFFLSEAQKILELDNKIFILDKNKKVVVAYDLEGNFLGQVGQKGLGPEEYESATDFVVDLNRNSVFIFSRGEQSILEFNGDLSFKRKIRIDIWAFQMSILPSGNLAFYTSFEEGNSNIKIFNTEGEPLYTGMPFPSKGDYQSMDYTGFLVDNYYSYPLSSMIYGLEGENPDSVLFNIRFPNQRSEDKKFEHTEFLNGPNWMVEHFMSKFMVGKGGRELLFYYSFKEKGASGFTFGLKLSSGQVFGHLNMKHGFKGNSDPFVKLFFIGPYNLPTYSPASGYYYTSSSNELMEAFYYNDQEKALEEIKEIDKALYETLNGTKELENPILMRFKLKPKL